MDTVTTVRSSEAPVPLICSKALLANMALQLTGFAGT
jgi:hypothetical protein